MDTEPGHLPNIWCHILRPVIAMITAIATRLPDAQDRRDIEEKRDHEDRSTKTKQSGKKPPAQAECNKSPEKRKFHISPLSGRCPSIWHLSMLHKKQCRSWQ